MLKIQVLCDNGQVHWCTLTCLAPYLKRHKTWPKTIEKPVFDLSFMEEYVFIKIK